jgi:hypothetical protein
LDNTGDDKWSYFYEIIIKVIVWIKFMGDIWMHETLLTYTYVKWHWTTLEALHPRINPAKFGWNWTSGFSQEDFLSSLYNL